jgi:hypothetical protein
VEEAESEGQDHSVLKTGAVVPNACVPRFRIQDLTVVASETIEIKP